MLIAFDGNIECWCIFRWQLGHIQMASGNSICLHLELCSTAALPYAADMCDYATGHVGRCRITLKHHCYFD